MSLAIWLCTGTSISPPYLTFPRRARLPGGQCSRLSRLDGFAHPEIVLVIGLVELAVFEAKRLGITKVAFRLFLLVVPAALQVLA